MNRLFSEMLAAGSVLITISIFLGSASGQTTSRNNPYSPSPGRNVKQDVPATPASRPQTGDIAFVMQTASAAVRDDRPTIGDRPNRATRSNDAAVSNLPSEIYKVGVGDVLFINIKNTASGSGYHTVMPDGTIDFPLAGENVIVAGQTVSSIQATLASGITLFRDPQVEVKVREYASHKVTVRGLVERPGEKSLQREAIPLFVIRAEAGVDGTAAKAVITRAPLLKPEIHELADPKTDNILIYPGNTVEFVSASGSSSPSGGSHFFIGGEVVSAGQKDLTAGLTLYQAVIASGGAKGDPKKATIRRRNEGGVFTIFQHNLRSIKQGKAQDPTIMSGDVIEIGN